ncbi:conserved hypothetical protein [Leptothrix cholodnii SP-6]|uniref:Lipoprotein n=1 Tax=Leptothrix cholodnii (strain ATCC 51168 / LMG 8142 / SP-6) TaxID=395495 RepID=B1Y534_LEPCP|nr:hypothetical protein [Leptothrix cholodnii]ACB35930.1 conserved hypothetical protein [Leptothrix cholodnii SP-6]
MHATLLLLTLAAATFLGACSSRMAYESGQAMQRNACDKIIDMQERQRCMARVNMPYDKYQREADEARGGAVESR